VPSAVVTSTLTLPLACGGTLALICSGLIILMFVAVTPPKLTEGVAICVPDVKFEPLTMTVVPPAGEAELGTIELISGTPLCDDVPGLRAEARSLRHELFINGTATTSRVAMHARIFCLSALEFMVPFLLTGLKPAGKRGSEYVTGRHSHGLCWFSFSVASELHVSCYTPLSVSLC
jgi:hypothetical protein